MAYNLADRFSPPPKRFTILDPGAYQNNYLSKTKLNKAPFLSKSLRNTQTGARIWTHTIYNANIPSKIQNCSSMMSKRPRFPYEALSKEDMGDILCRCGVQNVCECPSEEKEPKFVCQRKVQKRLFIGHPPRSIMGEGLSAPSRGDYGFKVNTDGSQKRLKAKVSNESPLFYDVRVDECTAFYQGCKWSRWTSKRSSNEQDHSPGPADYTLERRPTELAICAEAVRAYKRKRSKQLRFIEIIQKRNILEGLPGPATYSPNVPSDSNMKFQKAKRFSGSSELHPSPADYLIRRDFDLPIPPLQPCLVKLPEPSAFGVKADRFKPRKDEGPSPCTYNPIGKECLIMHCPTAPFGSSSVRFKQEAIEQDDEVIVPENQLPAANDSEIYPNACSLPNWEFRSKTIRMKPVEKKWHEQSPADMPQQNVKLDRLRQLQYNAPFFSSERRFQPWYDWMPVFGRYETPGPCYYNLEKPKCYPAVCRGPLVRTRRFPCATFVTPGPNAYKVDRGIETVLATHNHKLNCNIDNQHKFIWNPPTEPRKLTFEEQESVLLDKSIALLDVVDVDISHLGGKVVKKIEKIDNRAKSKLLHCFLYSNPTSKCI